jgi:D-alanyl-D-alanine carboxypeptidase/D-alanyl-D-alanine-endopeptidase (penicillin-binding protein 4)
MFPMRHLRTGPFLTTLLGIALMAALVGAADPAHAADDPVNSLLAQRLHNPKIGPDAALIVLDAASGKVIASHHPKAMQLPASNMKLVTAVDALTALGADARFTTRVRAGATASDLILQGGGDPLMSNADLKDLAAKSAAHLPAGQSVVVHVDDTLFAPASDGPGWTSAYVPSVVGPVSALARLNDYKANPAALAAKAFADDLIALGIPATVGGAAKADDSSATLAQSVGHSVAQDVALMLSVSENNIAEVLFRQVAKSQGQPTTWDGARAAAMQVLGGLGLKTEGLVLADGSGVSRDDRLSPTFLAQLVRYARVTNPTPYASMFADGALPLSGESGTLAANYGRYTTKQSKCAAGAIRAKTGTLFDTIGLSGIAQSPSGERIFSILVNNRPQNVTELATRQAVDGLAATITGCWGPRAGH